MEFHGYSYTHLDSLSHIFWNGMMYNGRPSTKKEWLEPGEAVTPEHLKACVL
ncbi:hypothetical protein V1289_003214 [Bradyrhizobium sp. AZCC 2289]